MSTTTKIERHARGAEVVRWLVQGRTPRWIADQLNLKDSNVRFTPADVSNFKKRLLLGQHWRPSEPSEPHGGRWTDDPSDARDILQRALDASRARPVGEPWDKETRETIQTEIKVARAKLELAGELPKNRAESKVAIRVKLDQAPQGSVGELIWQLLETQLVENRPKRNSSDDGGAKASDTDPEATK
jgi:hypothetical protein